jgi:hypothetical protein
MSALDIIEQIKALPRDEQAKVIEFARDLVIDEPKSELLENEEFKALVDRVFDKHANLMQRLAQ